MNRYLKNANKPRRYSEIRKELSEAECFGIVAVHEVYTVALENTQDPDFEQLLAWAKALLEGADSAQCRKDIALTGTYLFLYHNLWEYAKNHLNTEDYHKFCENQPDYRQFFYYE